MTYCYQELEARIHASSLREREQQHDLGQGKASSQFLETFTNFLLYIRTLCSVNSKEHFHSEEDKLFLKLQTQIKSIAHEL
jgi:hypothetical protein